MTRRAKPQGDVQLSPFHRRRRRRDATPVRAYTMKERCGAERERERRAESGYLSGWRRAPPGEWPRHTVPGPSRASTWSAASDPVAGPDDTVGSAREPSADAVAVRSAIPHLPAHADRTSDTSQPLRTTIQYASSPTMGSATTWRMDTSGTFSVRSFVPIHNCPMASLKVSRTDCEWALYMPLSGTSGSGSCTQQPSASAARGA